MHIVGMLTWWYTGGLKSAAGRVMNKLTSTFDYFSIDILFRTLFSPFRQISAGRVRGPLGVQLRAFFDRLLSRIIGSIVRSVVIVLGAIWIVISTVLGIGYLLAWLLAPLLPVIGFSLMAIGWIPWHL